MKHGHKEAKSGRRDDRNRRASRVDRRAVARALNSTRSGTATARELARILHLQGPEDARRLNRCLAAMLDAGELEQQGKSLRLRRERTLVGRVSAHPDGYGFVDVLGREKGLFVTPEHMRDLMHGDLVEVRIVRRRGREAAEVVRIVEQAPAVITGQFLIRGVVGVVEPRSLKMPQAILVRERDAKGAHDGDWVRLEILRGTKPLRGRVIEVLGHRFTVTSLIDLVVAEQQLPPAFPPPVGAEVAPLPGEVARADKKGRMDLRHLPFVTIDGEDAHDFDDAICVLPRGEGFEAWVAIADVAHYVQRGTALDEEARARGNSFYFPDRVIPMLPEKLSNGLCSLNPHVDRLVLAVRMRFDTGGRRRSLQIHSALIRSQARLTYAQAARWFEIRDRQAIADAEVRDMLLNAAGLYRMLARGRRRRGALDLDLPEVKAVIEGDRVVDLKARERNIAHLLIEEMMLAANTGVAEYMESRGCALLYRVHAPPEREAIEALNEYLAPLGLRIPLHPSRPVKPLDVQSVLARAEGKPFEHVLHRLILRSMQQAKYTPVNEGHFGLAYKRYCHFTSPIRRYADLTVHRRLKALLEKKDPDAAQPAAELARIGEHVSEQERKQQRSEWDTQAMLAALYHKKDIGAEMAALVSGVSRQRIFFELEPTTAEASMPVDELGGAFWLDDKNHRLVARRGGRTYALGDRIRVRIDATDPVRGLIRVSLPENP
jgi:ribonuclease R